MNYQFATNCQFDAPVLDKIYKESFGFKIDGWFVEVGASNGQDYSNTCGLADLGWHGIYIEPVKELAEKCQKRHTGAKVLVLNLAAGRYDYGEQTMWMIPEWGTATSSREAAEAISKMRQVFSSPVRTLDGILKQASYPQGFDLLVVDVDFGEIDVLAGFNIDFWKPKLVIIELHEESQHPLSAGVREFAEPYFSRGHEKIYKDGINTIFRRKG